MPSDADDDLASSRALANAIICDSFRRDPDRVLAVIAEVIERLRAERGYSAHQLHEVAQDLLDELLAESTEVLTRRGHADGGR